MLGYGRIRAASHMHTLKALEHDIDVLRSDLKHLGKSIKGGTKDRYSDMRAWFAEATKDMKAGERLGDAYGYVRMGSKRAANRTLARIERRPLVSIMGALAIGISIAMLFRRSRTS